MEEGGCGGRPAHSAEESGRKRGVGRAIGRARSAESWGQRLREGGRAWGGGARAAAVRAAWDRGTCTLWELGGMELGRRVPRTGGKGWPHFPSLI